MAWSHPSASSAAPMEQAQPCSCVVNTQDKKINKLLSENQGENVICNAYIFSTDLNPVHQVRRWQWTKLCSLTVCLLSPNTSIFDRVCLSFYSDEMHTFIFLKSTCTWSSSKPHCDCLNRPEDSFLTFSCYLLFFFFLKNGTGNEFLTMKTWVFVGSFKKEKSGSFSWYY